MSDVQDQRSPRPEEISCRGSGVSDGVAVGEALVIAGGKPDIVERSIATNEIPGEIARFEDALTATREQIHAIQEKVSDAIGNEGASIFDAHLLVVDDRSMVDEVIRGLKERQVNVESVVQHVCERYADALASVNDDYLRERSADVRDVSRRIIRNLAGEPTDILSNLTEPCIIIAHDLSPSDTASLDKQHVQAFATDIGSMTSHTAIMSRAMEIPAIVGLHDISTRIRSGDTVLVDGTRGLVIIHPSERRLEEYGQVVRERAEIRSGLDQLKDEPAETKDGHRILLSANIELPEDVDSVKKYGASGVGLFRTEFMFVKENSLPDEDEQAAVYDKVAQAVSPDPLIIRTLDVGGDKFVCHLRQQDEELNPFMGWRAIRFCIAQPDIFKAQLKAILRASRHKNISVMYPMISNVDEVLKANELLEESKHELRQRELAFNEDIKVGVMIEIPSAALTADLIAPHVDFFSLGTNDLVQYTLAVDRVNDKVAYLYEPTHPAIIKLIKHTIDVGHRHGIWTGVCGEMAASPVLAPLLLGLGADELSVNPSAVPIVKDAVRSIQYSEAEKLAQEALTAENARDVMYLCRKMTEQVAPEILKLIE